MKQADRRWDWDIILENGDFKKTDVILETGALFGEFSVELSERIKEIVVTDSYDWSERRFVEHDGINMVKEWENNLSKVKNIKLEKCNMEVLPYKDNSFDKVVCISAIEHVDKDRQAVEEMMRVLKPGGLLLLTTEYNQNMANKVVDIDGTFYRIYNRDEIDTLTNGFEVAAIVPQASHTDTYTTIFIKIKK